mmetsp:Transcript_15766/g.19224  ORF Transcript_15766/g.19224 Transcript_15766/m.19224 type:complete len:381 (-) Transcript_15766:111-1253(-)
MMMTYTRHLSRSFENRRITINQLSSSLTAHHTSRSSSSTYVTSPPSQNSNKPKVSWLDLNGSGLSAIERLCLEEALLRHDPLNRSWAIVGSHDPIYTTRLKLDYKKMKNNKKKLPYERCIIIMGLGGKPEKLLNIEKVRDDGVLVIKRFSGGGTVVVDHSSLWTTFIGRSNDFSQYVDPYPKSIMEWSAQQVFDGVFQRLERAMLMNDNNAKKTLIVDTKSCGVSDIIGQKSIPSFNNSFNEDVSFPKFELRENDYVLGQRKMGGNAQSIIKDAWLHHTSFLWDYDDDHMKYLTLPEKRPNYRGERHHDEFLVKLKKNYGKKWSDVEGKQIFFKHVKGASSNAFDLEEVSVREALKVVNDELGGFQRWFESKCRTRIINV